MDEDLKKLIESTATETRRHFDLVAEGFGTRLDRVTESIASLDQKVDRKAADLDDRLQRGFAETQSMIRFSHAELDGRVRALEQALADLQARVERLESSTH